MDVEAVPTAQLASMAAPYNPRKISAHDLEALERSMRFFGVVEPIVVNQRTGRIVGGHQRVRAAAGAEIDSLPVVYVDLDEPSEKQLNIALNRISGTWDDEKLSAVIVALAAEGADLELTGLEDAELKRLLAQHSEDGFTDPDDVPDAGPPVTQPGDLWICGEHRVLCGDATSGEDVARVMDDRRTNAVLTDPPYGIDQPGVPGDAPADHRRLIDGTVSLLPVTDSVVVSFASTRTFPVWLDAVRAAGMKFERVLTLYKEAQCTFPWRGWILKSESILVASIGKPRWNDVHPYSHDVYTISEVSAKTSGFDSGLGWHGSVKPISVVEDIAQRICQDGDLIYDPFLGSGTTLVAAERQGRTCYGMEIEPRYVDVIVRRWQSYTGKAATHADDSEPFDSRAARLADA
jgi:hypothetical protein